MPEKLYYRIGELASELSVPSHVIRYWEGEFNINPHRSASGQRLYRKHECNLFRRIKHLVHEEGYTLMGAKKVMAGHVPLGEAMQSQLLEVQSRLQNLKSRIHFFMRYHERKTN